MKQITGPGCPIGKFIVTKNIRPHVVTAIKTPAVRTALHVLISFLRAVSFYVVAFTFQGVFDTGFGFDFGFFLAGCGKRDDAT